MDLSSLKEEIAKKRKILESSLLTDNKNKFFKREKLIQKSEEEYWEKLKEIEEKKKKLNSKKNNDDQKDSNGENSEQSNDSNKETSMSKLKRWITNNSGIGSQDRNNMEERILVRKEVIKRLRDRGQPILLFGETEIDAFRRLRKFEIVEPDTTDKGFRNDFQEAMEKVDAAYLEEIVKSSGGDSESTKNRGKNDVKFEEMNTTIEEILEQAQYLGKQRSKRPSTDDEQRKCDCAVILKFLKFLLELWGKKLNCREEKEKRSTQGKISTAIYAQTQDYLKPMFKQLTKENIADDILKHLILIIKCLLERNYVKANDAYLQMAIGNAPWPIGVTMVGIHARTGREKIFAQNIAHVLNDETQRKYIQALKRLMTQCQKMFPTDPSRCVEYIRE